MNLKTLKSKIDTFLKSTERTFSNSRTIDTDKFQRSIIHDGLFVTYEIVTEGLTYYLDVLCATKYVSCHKTTIKYSLELAEKTIKKLDEFFRKTYGYKIISEDVE